MSEASKERARERARRWRAANPERKRETDKRWRVAHPEKVRESKRGTNRRRRQNDPAYVEGQRQYHLKRRQQNPAWRPRSRPLAERFWEKVEKRGPTDCWPWLGGHDAEGYGFLYEAGRMQRAHRVAWTLTHGPIPGRQVCCHSCDNPTCCNPSHLFLGTNKDNTGDMWRKGRARQQRRKP